jgi:uncharacterized protein (TIGR02145 family)
MLNLQLFSQVSISTNASPPHGSAMLDIKSTVSGLLIPRVTQAQREAISSPATGLLIYQTDGIKGFYYYSGTNWVLLPGLGAGGNLPSVCIDYDGNAYPTITIGTQTWMAEDLRVTHYRNGNAIPNITDNAAWAALATGAYCWFNNDLTTNEKYGALYNWYTVNDSRGLCPQGWHVPTDAEWTALTSYLGGTSVAGGKMKSVSTFWTSPNTDATNNSGFSGHPGGYRNYDGTFFDLGINLDLWSSTEYSTANAWYRYLHNSNSNVGVGDCPKRSGMSVRCLRD